MLCSQIKRYFSISFMVLMSLVFFMISGERVAAQQFINVKPMPLPIIPGNPPPVSQTGGNGNTPKAGQQLPINPGFPWLPINGPGSGGTIGGTPGITIDYTCPLLDQDGTSDLMTSLDALARALPVKDACKHDNTNFNELYQKQKDMFKSASEIKNFIANSKNLWVGDKSNEEYLNQINGFSNQISSLMSNVGYISESLGKNELLNSNCNSEMISKGKALHALSDLILQISPYAVLAANVSADMTLIGPVITGFTGLASLVNTVSKLNKNNEINMSESENRLMVMKAICEYMRIEGKLRYLRLAKIGTKDSQNEGLKKLNQLIYSKTEALKDFEKSLISKEENSLLVKLIEARSEFYNSTQAIRAQLKLDWKEYTNYDEFRNADNSENNLCSLGSFIVEDKKSEKFPYRIEANLATLEKISNFDVNTLSYRIAKKNFYDGLNVLENKVNSNDQQRRAYPGALTCGAIAQEALNSIAKLLQVIEEQVAASEKSYEEELKKNPSYKEWYEQNGSLIKERENLKGIVNVITKTSQQISPQGLSELSRRLELLRHTLFGTKDSFPVKRLIRDNFGININLKNQSPLGSWFEHTASQHEKFTDYFDKAFQVILGETKEELKDYIQQVEKNNKNKLGRSLVERLSSSNSKDYFQYITLKKFPVDSNIHKEICGKLRKAALDWEIAKEHLAEMKNVCSTLKDYIDIKTGEGVVEFCGIGTINRNANTQTFINEIEKNLEQRKLPFKANMVNQKYSELKCF